MKILVFSTAYYPFVGGAEVAIKEITDRLPEHDWHLITARMDRALPKMERVFGVTVHRVGFGLKTVDKFLLPILGFLKGVSLHRAHRFDRLWSMMASQSSIAASFLRMYKRIPLVLTLQEGDEETYLKRYVGGNELLYRLLVRPWYRLVFKKADRVTVISRYLESRAREAGYRGPIDLVPNGVDLARFVFKERVQKGSGETLLVTTSRLVEKNGVGDVIAALALLPKTIRFWIVGDGPLCSVLEQKVQMLGLSNRVVFHGQKKHNEMQKLLSEGDIFIRPSLSEGLGISFLEAMAAGLPVIATPVGGIVDFLTDAETGYFCIPKDPQSIARTVERVVSDFEKAKQVTRNARSLVERKYDWDQIVPSMLQSFENSHVSLF